MMGSIVTLTFDNGPDAEGTPRVLDVLRRRGLSATFFVVGERLRDPALRALAERAHDEGHWIGNHTMTHGTPLGYLPPAEAVREIEDAQAMLGPLAHRRKLFRPHGEGLVGPHLLGFAAEAHLRAAGYTAVLWNAVPRDWEDAEGWPERAVALCAAVPHALLVLHDTATAAMRRLDATLGRLADAGAAFRQDFPEECVPIRPRAAGSLTKSLTKEELDHAHETIDHR
jgi:peptidoglycan/xylan/chitin deacetylase (PgdA/CDA1 family)